MAEKQAPPGNEPNRLPLLLAGFFVVSVVMAGTVLLAGQGGPAAPTDATRPARVPRGDAAAVAGWQVPDFAFETLDGQAHNIADYRGQIVFLNFWATWCVPCQREMPVFEQFMATDPDGVVILAVNNGEDPAAVRDFQRVFRLEALPIVMDPDYVIADGFGVVNLPVTYVLDGDGVMQGFKLGEVTRADIDAYIAQIRGAG